MKIPHRLLPMWFFRGILFGALAVAVAACSTPSQQAVDAVRNPPVVQVQGNGYCHPSVDLPAHKTMKKIAPVDTFMEDVFALLAGERKDHASDIRDYNSLYSTCVGPAEPAK